MASGSDDEQEYSMLGDSADTKKTQPVFSPGTPTHVPPPPPSSSPTSQPPEPQLHSSTMNPTATGQEPEADVEDNPAVMTEFDNTVQDPDKEQESNIPSIFSGLKDVSSAGYSTTQLVHQKADPHPWSREPVERETKEATPYCKEGGERDDHYHDVDTEGQEAESGLSGPVAVQRNADGKTSIHFVHPDRSDSEANPMGRQQAAGEVGVCQGTKLGAGYRNNEDTDRDTTMNTAEGPLATTSGSKVNMPADLDQSMHTDRELSSGYGAAEADREQEQMDSSPEVMAQEPGFPDTPTANTFGQKEKEETAEEVRGINEVGSTEDDHFSTPSASPTLAQSTGGSDGSTPASVVESCLTPPMQGFLPHSGEGSSAYPRLNTQVFPDVYGESSTPPPPTQQGYQALPGMMPTPHLNVENAAQYQRKNSPQHVSGMEMNQGIPSHVYMEAPEQPRRMESPQPMSEIGQSPGRTSLDSGIFRPVPQQPVRPHVDMQRGGSPMMRSPYPGPQQLPSPVPDQTSLGTPQNQHQRRFQAGPRKQYPSPSYGQQQQQQYMQHQQWHPQQLQNPRQQAVRAEHTAGGGGVHAGGGDGWRSPGTGFATPPKTAGPGQYEDSIKHQHTPEFRGQHPVQSLPMQKGHAEAEESPRTVRVEGVDTSMDLEFLQLYFESPKSKGDTVTNIADHRQQGYVLVTFENSEVVDQVVQHRHSVSKRSLTVFAVADEQRDETSDDITCTVAVSGGDAAMDEEMMEIYFENRRKSDGGPITKIEVLQEAGMTLVTFQDAEAAERVVKRDHFAYNTNLIVVPYKPQGQIPKVKVSGLAPKVTEELLQLYFENVSQCDVEDVQLDRKTAQAVVTFTDPQAVDTVMAKEHHISGQKVTVSQVSALHETTTTEGSTTTTAATENLCSVEVSGLGPKTSEETIVMYFENKCRSDGGPVADIQFEEGSGTAIVTFEEAEAAEQVLEKQHTLDKKQVKVSRYSGSATPTDSLSGDMSSVGDLATITVHGLKMSTSEDMLLYYFENQRRSGGGEVKEVSQDRKKSVFLVTFQNPEDAARVISRKHTIDRQQVEVQLYHPPQMFKDRLLLGNLPDIRSADELLNFVEVRSKLIVDSLLFGDEEGTAVAVFESEIDRQAVQKALTSKQFKKRTLTIDPVPVSSTVLVSDLPLKPSVSEDTLLNYFENKRRSGGGDVENVEVLENQSQALVTFADTQVAAKVCNRQHKIQGCPVSVCVYMECLGLSGGSEEPTPQLPESITVAAADCEKLCLLQALPAEMDSLVCSLHDQFAQIDLNHLPQSASIICMLTPETEGVRDKVKTWTDDVEQTLQDCLADVCSQDLSVTEEEWGEAKQRVQDIASERSAIMLYYDVHSSHLQAIYKGQEQTGFVEELINTIKAVQQDLVRRKMEKTERVTRKRGHLLLLQKCGELKTIEDACPNLKLTFGEDVQYLDIKGPACDVQNVKLQLLELAGTFVSVPHKWDSDLHKELLHDSEMARDRLQSLCHQRDQDTELEFTRGGFEVHSFDAERAEDVQMAVRRAVQKRVIHFDNDNRQAVQTTGWAEQKRSVLNRNEGLLLIDETPSCLTLAGVTESIQAEFQTLKKYLSENSINEYSFPLARALFKLFRPFLQDKVLDMQLSMNDFNFDDSNNQVIIKGNSLQIEAAQNVYSAFRQELCEKKETYTQPSMADFFKSQEWHRKAEEIEKTYRCLVLDPEDIPDDFMGLGGDVTAAQSPTDQGQFFQDQDRPSYISGRGGMAAPSVTLGMSAQPSPLTKRPPGGRVRPQAGKAADKPKVNMPARPRLYLSIMSDITKEEHHVLVNSANTNLNMSQGQVSKALLEVGGPAIQEELKTKYPSGLPLGNIAVSGGGKLMCKNLIHCCLPEEKDKENIVKVVKEAVTKCMAEADKLEMGSIGFPSLGTGNLGYPADVVAQAMFEAALDYGRQHTNTNISDVFYILHKKDEALAQVFREEHDTYKQMLKDSQNVQPEMEESYLPPTNPSMTGVQTYRYFEQTRGRVKKVIIGVGETSVDDAQRELIRCYNGCIASVTEDVPHLENWDSLHVETIKNACMAVNVDVTFNFMLNKLELRGFRDNLGRVPVHGALKEAEADFNARQNAQIMLRQVQWSCIELCEDGEQLVPYDAMNNYKIEMAYKQGEEKVMVVDSDNKAFIVNFTTMEERPEYPDPQDPLPPMLVIRQDKINIMDVQPPREWTPMNDDLDVVPLQPNSDIYNNVAKTFNDSLQMPAAKIVKIERIQNLTLYKQYHAMKSQMEQSMPGKPCEKLQLWHGTKMDAVQGIIKYGFNRSYSDPQKSAYGRGAYFAVSAAYSSRNEYAAADPFNKERNIFQCRVLVGQYKLGDQNMRFPPELSSGQRCNSTVDDEKTPQIFVTFSDVQAYPEYRIVFKDS